MLPALPHSYHLSLAVDGICRSAKGPVWMISQIKHRTKLLWLFYMLELGNAKCFLSVLSPLLLSAVKYLCESSPSRGCPCKCTAKADAGKGRFTCKSFHRVGKDWESCFGTQGSVMVVCLPVHAPLAPDPGHLAPGLRRSM